MRAPPRLRRRSDVMALIPEMSVPPRARPVLTWLGSRPEDEYNALLAALPSSENDITSEAQLTARFQNSVEGADASQTRELASIVLSLIELHASHEWDLESIAETAASDDKLELNDGQRSSLRAWLVAALSNVAINRIAKVADVRTEYQSLFYHARVLTDLRPVFDGDDSKKQSPAMVIVHSLKIEYGTMEGTREIYLSLDSADLDTLEETIAQAKKDGGELRRFLKSANISELT